MPKGNVKVDKASGWNLGKLGGWRTYKAVLEEAAKQLEKIVEDKTLYEDEVVKRFDSTTTKMKFKAFGKTKPVLRKSADHRLEERLKAAQGLDDEPRVKELMRKQHDTIEMEINKLKEGKFGKVTNIFKMK